MDSHVLGQLLGDSLGDCLLRPEGRRGHTEQFLTRLGMTLLDVMLVLPLILATAQDGCPFE